MGINLKKKTLQKSIRWLKNNNKARIFLTLPDSPTKMKRYIDNSLEKYKLHIVNRLFPF